MSNGANAVHWTSTMFSETLMQDALLKHLLSLMQYGMADLGEVYEVIGQLRKDDEERWLTAWSDVARRLQHRAEASDQAGKRLTASSLYLRSATYWRASLMYFSHPEDPRLREYAQLSSKCYERYLEVSGYPGKYVEIPYEGGYLPGHFYRSPSAGEKAPLLILTPGRDTWAEDTCWVYDAALKRGIHCLVYDGPGQGYALRLNNLPFRPDWENVIGPVIDYALSLPGIDAARVGLMGLSFGGFLSTRAAAFEKRIKLCIVDPGTVSWGESIINHFPAPVRTKVVEEGPGFLLAAATGTPEHASLSWLVNDYAWKHGVPQREVFKALLAYDNSSLLDQIECRMLVLDGSAEMTPGQARRLFDALKCPKDYLLFDESTTAQAHCQIGAYATATEYLFDWIDRNL